ncbi:helix-turn-helix domain-containing protein [Catellatospora paridis]|uniref:helix-turn-helix domain-containing protein n=1 Tax=Catellatospora paridis TaxID=1617086 RepID=UPI0012D3EB0B|nr:helix-turn-helix transcriptional regulator [Catellatospora paridis]
MDNEEAGNEFGRFLRARRAELTPDDVGLTTYGGPRRVTGLRREEVAQLAAISTDYYTRLEQGRVGPSEAVLTTLARALRLDEDQQAYLRQVARPGGARPARRTAQRVRPQTRLLLDNLVDTPALVLGRHLDVLAWNPLAAALITDFGALPPEHRNYIRLAFLDPQVRSGFADWESVAHNCVAFLRMNAARHPDDPRLATLVGELSLRDPDFRRWWSSHQVAGRMFGTKTFQHPIAGRITLDWQMFASAEDPDQMLMILTAPRDTPAHQALRFLASWAQQTRPTPITS